MAHYKPLARKLRLAAAYKSNAPVPIWVSIRTRLKVRRGMRRRHWRRNKLKV
ncbi:MAG: 50S ribosomal protein L39e [Crenarchaeota archaeon]|nr:50S ribosomal protein L39e [Thermoproteota archaeon]